jgi:23S rRNA pseudouridine1911/1915/1917 synthase
LLLKDSSLNKVKVVSEPQMGAKEAILDYKVMAERDGLSLVRINLQTGRSHQIRVQFSYIGHPLYGDQKYGANCNKPGQQIALWSTQISCLHPTKNEEMTFRSSPPNQYPWNLFISG